MKNFLNICFKTIKKNKKKLLFFFIFAYFIGDRNPEILGIIDTTEHIIHEHCKKYNKLYFFYYNIKGKWFFVFDVENLFIFFENILIDLLNVLINIYNFIFPLLYKFFYIIVNIIIYFLKKD